MFWKRFRKRKNSNNYLTLKDNESAFRYAAEYIPGELGGSQLVYGIVRGYKEPKDKFITGNKQYICDLATTLGICRASNCGSIHDSIGEKAGTDISPIEVGDFVSMDVSTYRSDKEIDDKLNYFIIVSKLTTRLGDKTNTFEPKKRSP